MKRCKLCNKKLENKYGKKFCSRSCSAIYKNTYKHSTKGKGKGRPHCATQGCKELAASYGHKFCRLCIDQKKIYLWSKNPTKHMLETAYIKNNHRSSAYSYIRWHAREVVMKGGGCCEICGYSKHTEICHKKSIKEFSSNSTLNEINDKKNLVRLCPNCHWEFDHKQLKV